MQRILIIIILGMYYGKGLVVYEIMHSYAQNVHHQNNLNCTQYLLHIEHMAQKIFIDLLELLQREELLYICGMYINYLLLKAVRRVFVYTVIIIDIHLHCIIKLLIYFLACRDRPCLCLRTHRVCYTIQLRL